MPTYEYLCTDQGHRLEVVQRFTDDALTVCPECGGHLRKVIFPVGVVFKGSGFYRNDSRSGSADGAKANTADVARESGSKDGPKDGAAKEGSGKDGTPKDATPKESAPKNGARTGSTESSGPSPASGSPASGSAPAKAPAASGSAGPSTS